MWPYVCQFVEKLFKETIEPAIKEANAHLSTFSFTKIDLGDKVCMLADNAEFSLPMNIQCVQVHPIIEHANLCSWCLIYCNISHTAFGSVWGVFQKAGYVT